MRKQELHPTTAVLNRKQKNQAKKSRAQALSWLTQRFPDVFNTETTIRPLKIGIMADLFAYAEEANAAGVSRSKLREALVIFTRRIDYLTCLKAREWRVDLLGQPVAVVTEEEANQAMLKIKKRIEKSIKNARRVVEEAPIVVANAAPDYAALYAERNASLQQVPHYAATKPQKTPASVVIKHKPTRAFDPQAVARLKEKLGLSQATLLKDGNSR